MSTTWLNYFRIPRNEKLVGYWDTVADRPAKIRRGQNIDGVVSAASAFGAAINPTLLVPATSAGVDLTTILDDISAPLPHYRFTSMLTKAKELTAEVKAFGAALLAALEKRDAEGLARLRAGHEIALLTAEAIELQTIAAAIDITVSVVRLLPELKVGFIRESVATIELANHDLQITNAQQESAYIYSKYTNQELYDWTVGQLSTLYFQAYQRWSGWPSS